MQSNKYRQGSKTGIKTAIRSPSRHYPDAPQDTMIPSSKTIIAFGNASFGATMRGKKAAPVKLIKRRLQQMQTDNLHLCFIDEYLTSQVCNVCKKRNLENVTTANSKRRVHAVLKCKENTCNIVWNRDVNAAKNIYDIFIFAAQNNNSRPTQFQRAS